MYQVHFLCTVYQRRRNRRGRSRERGQDKDSGGPVRDGREMRRWRGHSRRAQGRGRGRGAQGRGAVGHNIFYIY